MHISKHIYCALVIYLVFSLDVSTLNEKACTIFILFFSCGL